MLTIDEQLARGALVCPRSRQPLVRNHEWLVTPSGSYSYPLRLGVPILLRESEKVASYLAADEGSMLRQYEGLEKPSFSRRLYRRLVGRIGDMRSTAAHRAFNSLFEGLPHQALCVSVGGGPTRPHPALVNVNLDTFPNVDIVADAYALPYANAAVDAIHCEAVLEHLEFPTQATEEMERILRPRGRLFAATPFLQVYHGYPDHYQNLTLTGHRRLFERAGFEIVAAGTCVGPTFALVDVFVNYLRNVLPGHRIASAASRAASVALLPLLFLDVLANRRASAVRVASTTYVLAQKMEG